MNQTSLTGSWSGAYRYPNDVGPETVFNARIEERGGAFVGTLEEPNLFLDDAATVLSAEIEGVRDGQSLSFTKFYNHQGIRHAVRYEGEANAALTRIDGVWIIRGDWSGAFFMTRDDTSEAAEAEARIAAPLSRE